MILAFLIFEWNQSLFTIAHCTNEFWVDGAKTQWCDDNDTTFSHRHCVEGMAARLLCSLHLLWFTFHLSSVLHFCVKFIVLLIVHFLKYNVCWLDFKINASRTESWKYNHSIMHIISPLPWYESPHSFRSISRQKKYKAFETFWACLR